MQAPLKEIFDDENLVKKIQKRLPYLFQIAELESSRAGKVGMEVGSVRERIIIALLIYKFGEENVETDLPITEPEIDVKVFNKPVFIKTITGKNFSGVKLIWTVDAQKSRGFLENYYPNCDMIFTQINWNNTGGFYYIPVEIQREFFEEVGKEKYIRLPKEGTNPRGVEITKDALARLIEDSRTYRIIIEWYRSKIKFNQYKKWIELWSED